MPTAIFVSGSYPNEEVESEGQREVVVPEREAMAKRLSFDEYVASSRSQEYCVIISTDNTSKQGKSSMDQMYDKQAQIRNNSTYCKQPGCGTENYFCTGEYCRRHPTNATTATPKCAKVGCDIRTVSARKYCRLHDRRRQCKIHECSSNRERARYDPLNIQCILEDNCDNLVSAKGFCERHDRNRKKKCKEDNCDNLVRAKGYCWKHGPNRKKCKEDNCDHLVRANGYCWRHGPNVKKCKEDSCDNLARKRGYCWIHDPSRKKCKEDSCDNIALARGYCLRHGPNRKKCKEVNCDNIVQAKGYCSRHGPNVKKIKEDNCDSLA